MVLSRVNFQRSRKLDAFPEIPNFCNSQAKVCSCKMRKTQTVCHNFKIGILLQIVNVTFSINLFFPLCENQNKAKTQANFHLILTASTFQIRTETTLSVEEIVSSKWFCVNLSDFKILIGNAISKIMRKKTLHTNVEVIFVFQANQRPN